METLRQAKEVRTTVKKKGLVSKKVGGESRHLSCPLTSTYTEIQTWIHSCTVVLLFFVVGHLEEICICSKDSHAPV